jgi:hypothetical protein
MLRIVDCKPEQLGLNLAILPIKVGYTKRFCQLVSGLYRHMSIQAVSRHLSVHWETVKDIRRFQRSFRRQMCK